MENSFVKKNHIRDIFLEACRILDIDAETIRGKKRNPEIAEKRHLIIHYLYHQWSFGKAQIGDTINRSHWPIYRSIRLVEDHLSLWKIQPAEFRQMYLKLNKVPPNGENLPDLT